jgi:hypothetical protein
MKAFHITYKENETDNICTGKRYNADNAISALIHFENEYPNALFLYIASEDMFNYKY